MLGKRMHKCNQMVGTRVDGYGYGGIWHLTWLFPKWKAPRLVRKGESMWLLYDSPQNQPNHIMVQYRGWCLVFFFIFLCNRMRHKRSAWWTTVKSVGRWNNGFSSPSANCEMDYFFKYIVVFWWAKLNRMLRKIFCSCWEGIATFTLFFLLIFTILWVDMWKALSLSCLHGNSKTWWQLSHFLQCHGWDK